MATSRRSCAWATMNFIGETNRVGEKFSNATTTSQQKSTDSLLSESLRKEDRAKTEIIYTRSTGIKKRFKRPSTTTLKNQFSLSNTTISPQPFTGARAKTSGESTICTKRSNIPRASSIFQVILTIRSTTRVQYGKALSRPSERAR